MSAAHARDTAPAPDASHGAAPSNGTQPTTTMPPSGGGKRSAAQRFDVIERLGDEGTLWVTYRAREKATGELRALKALKSAFARHAAFSRALYETAQGTLDWSHPHLARLHETGFEDNTLFLAQEWLPGPSLEVRLKRAPLPTAETAHIARHIAGALGYLAERDQAHGDLRPRQILGAGDGSGAQRPAHAQPLSTRWALTDGGLWRAYGAANLSLSDVQSDAIFYFAPERCDGAPASPQTDVYALGVILYRMLTGRVPFDGPSPLAIARRHKNDGPLRPAQWNSRVAPELEALTISLLHKDPAQRPSAADIIAALAPSPAATAPVPAMPLPDTPVPATTAATPVPVAATPANAVVASVGAVPVAAAAAIAPAVAVAPVVAAPVAVAPVAAPRMPVPVVPVADDAGLDDAPGVFDEQAEKAEEKRQKKRHGRREALGAFLALFWMLISAGILGGILFGAYYAWQENSPKEVPVPPYVGKSREEAAKILDSRGLKMSVRSTRYDPKKPEGTVLSGDQPAGKKVKQGREILVTVSQGPQPVRVLDFRELTVQRARQIIARQGMTLGQIAERYDSRVPRGYVCDQFPQPGETVSPAEPLNLVVSKGRQPPIEAPDADNLSTVPGEPAVPLQDAPDEDDLDQSNPDEAPDATLVSRSVRVEIDVPQDGSQHTVQVEVNDENGQKTIYNRTHKPGDTIVQTVRITRRQGTVATIRVYLDDEMLTEKRI